MKYMIYEDPSTHRFAFLPLPSRFIDGDALPIAIADRWFDSHAEAIAALPELFDRDERERDVRADDTGPAEDVAVPVHGRLRH